MNPPHKRPGAPADAPTPPPLESTTPPAPAEEPSDDGVPRPLPAPFGRYRLQKLLGQGGMGAVYLAHDPQLDRPVALKVPRITAADGPQVLARFYREAKAAATVPHPNICPIYDVGQVGATPYLTMAYVEGRPLSEFVRLKPLTPRQSAALVRKLALALHAAHRRGVIHRDLKPSNVMIDQRGEPIVMDFGLARRAHGGDPRLTRSGAVLGTPAYMPPEQARGNVEASGPAGDVYSLGVILYELLTGRLPFQGDPLALLFQIVQDEPPPPSSLRKDLDAGLEAICLKAMAKKVEDRYVSAAALAGALSDYLRQKTGESPRPEPTLPAPAARPAAAGKPPPLGPRVPRRRRGLAWLWLLGGALVALPLLGWLFRAPLEQAWIRFRWNDNAAPVKTAGDRTPAPKYGDMRPAPAASDGPDWFIFTDDNSAAVSDENHPAYKKIQELCEKPGRVLNGVAFTPSGDWVILYDGSRFAASDPDLPACQALADLGDAHALNGVAFTPRGGWAVFADPDLSRNSEDIPKNARTAISKAKQDGDALRSVAFGPEGYWVVLHGENDVSCYAPPDLAALLNDLVEKKSVPIRCVAFSPAGDWFVLGGDNACWSSNPDHPAFKRLQELRGGHTLRWIAFAPARHP